MELDRLFTEHVDKDAASESFEFYGNPYNSVTWTDLLKRRRAVVLAEAGSGKSTEFKLRSEAISLRGGATFLRTVHEAAERGFEQSLTRAKQDELTRWRASADPGWFFLDSVDEAKARGAELRHALSSLADVIAGCERRAHVLISGRPSDWEARRDLALFCEILPIPDDVLAPRATESSRMVVNVLRGAWPKQAAPREAPLVVTMLPLDDGRIARFARANGIDSVETFLEALERNGLMRFARRPLDLQWLVDHWQANRAFGSLREMLTLSVNKRLTETNTQLARIDALTLDACNEAADRIGAAMVLQEVDSIAVPDSGLDRLETVDALDLAQLLPNWTSADRVKLISRAAFPPSRAGFVRLHNDNEGIVRSFLAARWFLRLLSAHCPRTRIHELLFAESYGVAVVIPSMVKTVAWLAISESWVAEEALRRDPISLLEFGDPASLPLDVRVRALRAAIDAPEDQRFARITNFSSLRRLAQPDMAAPVRALWAELKANSLARRLLLQIIWIGRLTSCADIATEASFGAYDDRPTQMFANRAVAIVGSEEDKQRCAAYLVEQKKALDTDVFWNGAADLFPEYLTVDALADALADQSELRLRDMPSFFVSIPRKLETGSQAQALLKRLLEIIRTEGSAPQGHPFLDTARSCATRLVSLSPRNPPEPMAVETFVEGALSDRRNRARESTAATALREALTSTPQGRRAVLWAATKRFPLTGINDSSIISPHTLEVFGIHVALRHEDVDWLIEDAQSCARDDDARLAVNAVMRMWSAEERPPEIVDRLSEIAAHRPAVEETLDLWLKPPSLPVEEAAIAENMRQTQERHEREMAESDASWRTFVEDLRSNPAQLRSFQAPTPDLIDGRIYNLWQLVDGMAGSATRHAGGDLRSVIPVLSREVVVELTSALRQHWRQWTPIPPAERPAETRGTRSPADLVGLLGVAVEAYERPEWANQLSAEEARLATLYATLEINGFPVWLPQLAAAQSEAVRESLLRCSLGEWNRNQAEPFECVFDDLARSDASVCALVAPALLAKFQASPPPSTRILETVVQIIDKGCADRPAVAAAMLSDFRNENQVDRRAICLACAFSADPLAATQAFGEVLDGSTSGDRSALVESLMPRIFGGDWSQPASSVSSMPLGTLRRLVEIAHEDVPPSEDPVRANGEVFSPGTRDIAQTSRGQALFALANRPGLATYETLKSMSASGLPVHRSVRNLSSEQGVLDHWALERARQDAQPAPWKSEDVVGFERHFLAAPRTPKDLQTVAIHRLTDLQKQLTEGDFNQGAVVAALPDESAVQNWFAYEFKRESREAFSIEREPHVADEKEPDLRLQAKASDARLPIEIKVAESWSLRQLEDALTSQLQGRYLRDPQSKWGILLLVHQTPRAHGWKDGNNGFLSIDQLVEHLRSRAHEIAATDAGAAQMAVVLVDVSSKYVKR